MGRKKSRLGLWIFGWFLLFCLFLLLFGYLTLRLRYFLFFRPQEYLAEFQRLYHISVNFLTCVGLVIGCLAGAVLNFIVSWFVTWKRGRRW